MTKEYIKGLQQARQEGFANSTLSEEELEFRREQTLDTNKIMAKIAQAVEKNKETNDNLIYVDLRGYTINAGNLMLTSFEDKMVVDQVKKEENDLHVVHHGFKITHKHTDPQPLIEIFKRDDCSKYGDQQLFPLMNFGDQKLSFHIGSKTGMTSSEFSSIEGNFHGKEIVFNFADANIDSGNWKLAPNQRVSILADRISEFNLDIREVSSIGQAMKFQVRSQNGDLVKGAGLNPFAIELFSTENAMVAVGNAGEGRDLGAKITNGKINYVDNEGTKENYYTLQGDPSHTKYNDENGPKFLANPRRMHEFEVTSNITEARLDVDNCFVINNNYAQNEQITIKNFKETDFLKLSSLDLVQYEVLEEGLRVISGNTTIILEGYYKELTPRNIARTNPVSQLTLSPTLVPTDSPTKSPSYSPTEMPTGIPTFDPTSAPTLPMPGDLGNNTNSNGQIPSASPAAMAAIPAAVVVLAMAGAALTYLWCRNKKTRNDDTELLHVDAQRSEEEEEKIELGEMPNIRKLEERRQRSSESNSFRS